MSSLDVWRHYKEEADANTHAERMKSMMVASQMVL